jgi:hypothetical protein
MNGRTSTLLCPHNHVCGVAVTQSGTGMAPIASTLCPSTHTLTSSIVSTTRFVSKPSTKSPTYSHCSTNLRQRIVTVLVAIGSARELCHRTRSAAVVSWPHRSYGRRARGSHKEVLLCSHNPFYLHYVEVIPVRAQGYPRGSHGR